MLDSWADGESRNVHAELMAVTLDIVAQCLFGAEVASATGRVGKAMEVITDRFMTDASQALLLPIERDFSAWLPKLGWATWDWFWDWKSPVWHATRWIGIIYWRSVP